MTKTLRKDARETRHRLLAAAARVFAEEGYWEATHAEICRLAKANIAAVNYHFGSKENLYVEAWKHAFELSVQAHPPDGGVPPEAPAEERLRGHIRALMARMIDPDNREADIMHKEMANPTGLLGEAISEVLEPMRQYNLSIVRGLLGEDAREQDVELCGMSIASQCFGPVLRLRRVRREPAWLRPHGPPMPFSLEDLTDHIVRFSLAGISGVRKDVQQRNKVAGGSPREKRSSKQRQS
jgi:TetR/AcrR family transcriptional regulator, regulator of cefoperazone and chloramphenicol sensitivity